MKVSLFYRPKPVFGLDIGHSTIKLMQVETQRQGTRVLGYGYANFDPQAIVEGAIVKPELLTQAIKPLMKQLIFGKLSTNRIATALPSRYAFTRLLNLPNMNKKDLAEAARLEAEQYIPVPLEDLYIEYEPIDADLSRSDANQTVLMVAIPKKIVDSYIAWFDSINLETALIETNLLAFARLIKTTYKDQQPRIVLDFGAESCELAIYDKTIRHTSTIAFGGNQITEHISKILGIDLEKAHRVKVRYGIASSKWQKELAEGLQGLLSDLATEVQKMMRYYRERTDKKIAIESIVITGGGANLPGLAEFLSHLSGVAVEACNPWEQLVLKSMQPPHITERTLYNITFGLALYNEEQND